MERVPCTQGVYWGGSMAVRVLSALAVLVAFYGRGQSNPTPEENLDA